MASTTTNYNLRKIDLTDAPPDITVLNANWDKIDRELKSRASLNEQGKVPEEQLPDITNIPVTNEVPDDSDIWIDPDDEPTVEDAHVANKNNPHGVTAEQVGAVPTTRKVNGKPLSSDVTLNATDVGAAPAYTYGTTDLTAGTSTLATGKLYFVYE